MTMRHSAMEHLEFAESGRTPGQPAPPREVVLEHRQLAATIAIGMLLAELVETLTPTDDRHDDRLTIDPGPVRLDES